MCKKASWLLIVVVGLGIQSSAPSWADSTGQAISLGNEFPSISLAPPADNASSAYLGVKENQYFTIQDIQAELVLVEIMNTHCISCIKQAPALNALFGLLDSDAQTRAKIKIVAIAAGNADADVADFKARFQVPFPIIADPKFQAWDATGRSKTPFSIFVRQRRPEKASIVVGTHLGVQSNAAEMRDELLALADKPPPAPIRTAIAKAEKDGTEPTALYSPQKTMELMVMSIFKAGIVSEGIKAVELKKSGIVYLGKGKRGDRPVRVFMKPVYRFLPCDACHDAQFIYIFQDNGEILDLVPMRLTKHGNQPFTEEDVDKIRGRVVGKRIFDPLEFNPEVDAISTATITSSIIYKALQEGRALYEELKVEGLIAG